MEYHDTPIYRGKALDRRSNPIATTLIVIAVLSFLAVLHDFAKKDEIPMPDKEGFYMTLKRHAVFNGWNKEVERAK